MEVVASGLVWAGLVTVVAGVVNVIKPLRWVHIRSRRTGGLMVAAGLLAFVVAVALPPGGHQASTPASRLDALVPSWQFAEAHEIRVRAPRERVWRAMKDVTAEEIRLFRILTWIRHPRRPWEKHPESILAPTPGEPILEVALRSGFVSLAEEPGRELVVGAIVCCGPADPKRLVPRFRQEGPQSFARLDDPGVAKAGMNFALEDEGGGWTRLTTQTRVWATDEEASRRFAIYWRIIYPGSALIRRMWLRAIKARAERLT